MRMRERVKQLPLSVYQSVCQFLSLVEKFLNLNIDKVKRFVKLTIVKKKVTYVYLIGSKAVLYPLLFQQFPI